MKPLIKNSKTMRKMLLVNSANSDYDVYVGRGSKYGNPFRIGVDGDREEVIRKYRVYVEERFSREEILEDLEDKVLGCWCFPKPCHADILLEIIYGD